MQYIIYTFGGGDTLCEVFNAVGRIFASDSEYFTPVGKFAMSIGGVWAATRAIFNGNIGIFGKQWFFPSFLAFVFLFSPKVSVWIKDETTMAAPVKVDNIPVGVAFFSSISSSISYALSEMLEKHLLPVDSGLSIRSNGIMFGAKAVGKIRDIQIQNPITLTNTKEFTRQCFTKPYVIGNISGKKAEAQQATDIIDFLEQNPANNFGIYYKEPINHNISFKTCSQATPLIKAALQKELGDGLLLKFAIAIGMHSEQTESLKRRLKVMTDDTLRFLKKDQADLHQWMKQAMLLNANRESLDDWREKHSLARLYPQLVSMNATRGMFQQSFGYLTAGEIAANMMPILQSAFLSLIVCLSFIVFPMSMLPSGFNILKTWITLMIWVGSWSVFFTIVHCLGMISLSGKAAAFGADGMSILSQAAFSELTLNSYATYQLLAASVPMLAWATIKGCTHATTSLASAFSPISIASTIGANIADNNISMDNISHGNRTIEQQNLVPSLHMGAGIIDDGGMRVMTVSSGGQFITEQVDSLATNFSVAQMYSDGLQTQLMDSQSKMASLTERASSLTSTEQAQITDFTHRISKGEAAIEGMSYSDQQQLNKALSYGTTASDNYSSRDSKDTSTSTSASLGLSFGGSGIVVGVSATNSHSNSYEQSALKQQAYNEALNKVKSAVKSGDIKTTSDAVRSSMNALNDTWREQEQIAIDKAKTLQTMEALQNQKTYVEQNSANINRNMNAPVLEEIMRTQAGVHSKEQAARWVQSHYQEAKAIAQDLAGVHNILPTKDWKDASTTANNITDATATVNNMPIPSKEELLNTHEAAMAEVKSKATVTNSEGKSESLEKAVENNLENAKIQYSGDVKQVLTNNLSEQEAETMKDLQNLAPTIEKSNADLKEGFDNTNDSTIIRTGAKAGEHIVDSLKDINDALREMKDKK